MILHWQHPVTGHHARCQFKVNVSSRAPMVTVCEETREQSTRNSNTTECKDSHLKDWRVHRGRPRLLEWIQTVAVRALTCSTLCATTVESTLRSSLEKHRGGCPSQVFTSTRWIRDDLPLVKKCLLQAVMAHSRLLKHGGYTLLQLLFGHELAPIAGDTVAGELKDCSITESMAERLTRQQSAMKAWLQAEAESRVERAQSRRTNAVLHWLSGTRVCYWRADVPNISFLLTIRQGSTAILNKHKWRLVRSFEPWHRKGVVPAEPFVTPSDTNGSYHVCCA